MNAVLNYSNQLANERAVWDVLEEGKHLTGDLGGSANTAGFSDAIIDKL